MRHHRFLHVIAFLCIASAAAANAVATNAQGADRPAGSCQLQQLPGLSAQYARALRSFPAIADPNGAAPMLSAAGAADFWMVARSVLRTGMSTDRGSVDGRQAVARVELPSLAALPCDVSVRARDRVAWSMSLVGYSAREIADVIDGHLTRETLDQAYARAISGEPRERVAAFLESHWRDHNAVPAVPALPAEACRGRRDRVSALDALSPTISTLADQHRVPQTLIRALIVAESGGNPCAVSRAGAIGLMQLMPATAAALGVDPWNPLDNLRGGVAYLASLLRSYGEDVRLALIAYNAGPQHAERVRAGRAVPYRETRHYLDAIAARFPFTR